MRFSARVAVVFLFNLAYPAHIVAGPTSHSDRLPVVGAQQQPLLEPVRNRLSPHDPGTLQVGQAAFYHQQEEGDDDHQQQGQNLDTDVSKSTQTDTGFSILSRLAQDPLAALASGIQGHTSIKSLVDDSWAITETDFAGIMSSTAPSPPSGIPDRPPLINFENNVPPRRLNSSSALEETTITLLTHSFANSYGKPARTSYSLSLLPPSYRDPSKWTALSLDQVGRARGRQFDRLGSIFLDGVEIVRTDNAEPVNTTGGVTWTTRKDVSKYFTLFSKSTAESNSSEIVFQYPNIVDETYTSPLNLTLSLTVQQLRDGSTSGDGGNGTGSDQDGHHISDCPALPVPLAQRTPQAIYAISKNGPDLFNVPDDSAQVSLTVPRNAVKALLEVYASGTAADEFWYTGVNDVLFDQTINGSNALTPHGPYREVQILIDGKIAGIAAPYPVIFTGGLNPLLWRPQTSYGSYDQPTYLFDVTPFLGMISDGNPHNYAIQVISAEQSKTIPKGWFVTANLQLVFSKDINGITTGHEPIVQGPAGAFDLTGSVTNGNFSSDDGALTSDVKTRTPRTLTIVGRITPAGSGSAGHGSGSGSDSGGSDSGSGGASSSSMQIRVEHTIDYTSHQDIKHSGGDSTQTSHTKGTQKSTHGPTDFLNTDYSFPLSTHITSNNASLNVSMQSAYKSTVVFGTTAIEFDSTAAGAGATTSTSTGTCRTPDDATTFGLPDSHSYDVTQHAQASTTIKDGRLSGGLGGNNSTIKYFDSQGFTYDRTLRTYNYTVTQDKLSGTLKDLAPPVQ